GARRSERMKLHAISPFFRFGASPDQDDLIDHGTAWVALFDHVEAGQGLLCDYSLPCRGDHGAVVVRQDDSAFARPDFEDLVIRGLRHPNVASPNDVHRQLAQLDAAHDRVVEIVVGKEDGATHTLVSLRLAFMSCSRFASADGLARCSARSLSQSSCWRR